MDEADSESEADPRSVSYVVDLRLRKYVITSPLTWLLGNLFPGAVPGSTSPGPSIDQRNQNKGISNRKVLSVCPLLWSRLINPLSATNHGDVWQHEQEAEAEQHG